MNSFTMLFDTIRSEAYQYNVILLVVHPAYNKLKSTLSALLHFYKINILLQFLFV